MDEDDKLYLLRESANEPHYQYEVLADYVKSAVAAEMSGVVSLIRETSQRYSRGSVTRVAMDNLLLEISERFPAASMASDGDEESN
jgi:hypothetical protein